MDHFRNPRNVGILDGEGVAAGRVGNPTCGDLMDIYIKVENDVIVDIKFKTFGCGSAIATSSMITELALGKTLDEALQITRKDVADELDGLPPIKMHCSNLAADALQEAIKNYRTGKKINLEDPVITKTCAAIPEPKEIVGLKDLLNKGVYKKYDDLERFRNQRILIIENGEKSIKLALELTKYTGRVIFSTPLKNILASEEIKSKLKKSFVKVLNQTRLLEVMGTNSLEKIKMHDLDEDEEYELFVDALILP